MEFRKATIEDVETLMKLRKQMFADDGLAATCNIDEEMRDYFTSGFKDGSFIARFAIESGEIVAVGGVCVYALSPSYNNPTGRVAYITNMFTQTEYRRKGIASAILTMLLEDTRALGYSRILLHASAMGRKVYEKFGFTDVAGYMALPLNTAE